MKTIEPLVGNVAEKLTAPEAATAAPSNPVEFTFAPKAATVRAGRRHAAITERLYNIRRYENWATGIRGIWKK